MNWKKHIYDDLTGCSTLCDAFATECSGATNIDELYRSIILSLDCADVCRQLAILYVRGSENTRLMAKACIEVCAKCAQEVSQFNSEVCRQVYAMCQQAIMSCVLLSNMTDQPDAVPVSRQPTPSSIFYGIDLRETLYN